MPKRILVIDDEELVRKMLHRVLSLAGYDIVPVSNGRDALELLKSGPVDLIILDMNMPGMNGIDFLMAIRGKNVTRVPVLMMSGSSDPEHRAEAYRLGVYDFIRKPEDTEVMMKRIENGLHIGDMINFNEFMKVELLMARKLQKYLFPDPLVATDTFIINIWSRPLSDIGGDLYDYVIFRNGDILYFVADVSGHSISAALYTAIVKMVFRNAIKESDDPAVIMSIMNRELSENLPMESFVTMFCGRLVRATSEMVYCNAGHPLPYLVTTRGITELQGNDAFLGPIKDAAYADSTIRLEPGDGVLIYTDGVVDLLKNPQNTIDEDTFIRALEDTGADPLEKFSRIREMLSGDDTISIDDCTLMMIKYTG